MRRQTYTSLEAFDATAFPDQVILDLLDRANGKRDERTLSFHKIMEAVNRSCRECFVIVHGGEEWTEATVITEKDEKTGVMKRRVIKPRLKPTTYAVIIHAFDPDSGRQFFSVSIDRAVNAPWAPWNVFPDFPRIPAGHDENDDEWWGHAILWAMKKRELTSIFDFDTAQAIVRKYSQKRPAYTTSQKWTHGPEVDEIDEERKKALADERLAKVRAKYEFKRIHGYFPGEKPEGE